MRFSAGYQHNDLLKQAILRHTDRIGEIYFSYPGIENGRGGARFKWSEYDALRQDLADYSRAGLALNLLLNGNCYGAKSLSRGFYTQVGDTVESLVEAYGVSSVTTTSPVIAKFLKANFPTLETRASVNMEIGDMSALDYLAELFDGFYLKREYNYDLARLDAMRARCRRDGKKLFLLANSGCLSFCPARTFHDNLVSHQDEIAQMDNAYDFHGLCHEFLSDESGRAEWLSHSCFIRPEDIAHYEGRCDGVKLATRVSRYAALIVEAYCAGTFRGNLLELTEPCYADHFAPQIIANDRLPVDFWDIRTACEHSCGSCGKCREMQSEASITLT